MDSINYKKTNNGIEIQLNDNGMFLLKSKIPHFNPLLE